MRKEVNKLVSSQPLDLKTDLFCLTIAPLEFLLYDFL